MRYTPFHEQRFRNSVNNALRSVQAILEHSRLPRLAEEADHEYEDKFALAEFMTNTAIAALMNALERMGLDEIKLATIVKWVHQDKLPVTLRFELEETCAFLKEQDVTMLASPSGHQLNPNNPSSTATTTTDEASTSRGFFGSHHTDTTATRPKVTQTVKEFHWKVNVTYKLMVFAGNDPDSGMVLQNRSSSTNIITCTGTRQHYPLPEQKVMPPADASLTWLFQMISPTKQVCQFSIDRASPECKTPRRNPQVDQAVNACLDLYDWTQEVQQYFEIHMEEDILGKNQPAAPPPKVTRPTLANVSSKNIFCPIMPLLDWTSSHSHKKTKSNEDVSAMLQESDAPNATAWLSHEGVKNENVPLLSLADLDKFLNEQIRSIVEVQAALSRAYPPRQLVKLVSVAEATLVLMCKHLKDLTEQYQDSMGYLEHMLHMQLVQAIGKEVETNDFDQFVAFHFEQLLGSQYAPKPFCRSVGCGFPDGIVSIETAQTMVGTTTVHPIRTTVRQPENPTELPPIQVPINSATSLQMTGERFLHGWMQHRFTSGPKPGFHLVARARQFSCFILALGNLTGPARFEPQHAIVVQNKDELMIPILLSELPSAREFRDAIKSLSPEQRDFAEKFRAMQLESAVFCIGIFPIKPQLEKVLNLPPESLTKEIRLTQDLLDLFTKYQIPSDMVSFGGEPDEPTAVKIGAVRIHVQAVKDVIEEAERQQRLEEQRLIEKREAERIKKQIEEEEQRRAEGTTSTVDPGTGTAVRGRAPLRSRSSDKMTLGMMSLLASGSSTRGVASRSTSPLPERGVIEKVVMPEGSTPIPTTPLYIARKSSAALEAGEVDGSDFTNIPKMLDRKLSNFDDDKSLRSTVVKIRKKEWKRKRQANIFSAFKESELTAEAITSETQKAFDLLDAISRSGRLPIAEAELHVVVAVTHVFDNDVIGTVVQDNVDPIAKVEKSNVLLASVIHGVEAKDLITDAGDLKRLGAAFPALFSPEKEK